MDPVCPSQKTAHRNAKRKQDDGYKKINPSVKKMLFCCPLPNPEGFPPEEDLKSKVDGPDLVNFTDAELFNMVPSQKDYWKHH